MNNNFENAKTLTELFSMLYKSDRKDTDMIKITFNSSRENRKKMTKGFRVRQDFLRCGLSYNGELAVCLGSYMVKHPEVKNMFPAGTPMRVFQVTIEFNADTLEIKVYNNIKEDEQAFIAVEKQFTEVNITTLVEQITELFGYDLHECTPDDETANSEDDDADINDEDTDNCEDDDCCDDDCCGCSCGGDCCSCYDCDDEDKEDCCGCEDDCPCCEDDCCRCSDSFDDLTLSELKELAMYGEKYLAEQETATDDSESSEACDITEYDRALKIIKEASEKLFSIELADREAELIYTVLFNSKQISDNLYK